MTHQPGVYVPLRALFLVLIKIWWGKCCSRFKADQVKFLVSMAIESENSGIHGNRKLQLTLRSNGKNVMTCPLPLSAKNVVRALTTLEFDRTIHFDILPPPI